MLKKMKFVQGSVAKKDLLPALTHFRIENGHIQGFNGRIALSAPIDFDVDCTPKAEPLVRAISRCTEAVVLGMTKSGKLSVKSGKFRTYIDCVEGPTAHTQPTGDTVDIDGEVLLNALRILQPFIGNDAARPWSMGVLFDGQSAFATNNVVIAEHWLGAPFPVRVVVPRDAVKEMLRLKEAPIRFQMSNHALTAHYADGKWMMCNLIEVDWPDVRKVLDVPSQNLKAIPAEFFTGLESLKGFTDQYHRVIFDNGVMRTHAIDHEEGAGFELSWLEGKSTFSLPMISSLQGIAEKIDLSLYPKPCPWFGGAVRGAIIGMHWLEGEL